ncbi:MAG: carbon starvation protein A, partial [Oscillospiraceae bacterium]|nr:carbon starvation protein A [Oscillospiraceae bacterium]
IEGGLMTGLKEAMALGQSACVYNICYTTMGGFGAILAMLGVIACPISSGDTAFRSARLTVADALNLDQKSIKNRILLTVPLLGLGVLVSQLDYTAIWNYFASTNQILAAIVLWTAAFYLRHEGKKDIICSIPAAWMTAVTLSFVFSSNLYLGGISFFPPISKILGVGTAVVLFILYTLKAPKAAKAAK